MMKIDAFDDCIIGTSSTFHGEHVVCSIAKIIEHLMEKDGMDYDEAYEYFGYNIGGAYVGENTPIFVYETEEL